MNQSFAIFREANHEHLKICIGNLVQLNSNWNINSIPQGYLLSPWPSADKLFQIQGNIQNFEIENLISFLEGQKLQLQDSNDTSTTFDAFSKEVLSIQSQISLGNFEKAVASRVHVDEVHFDLSQIANWFKQLLQAHKSALVALVFTQEFGLWIGASPETLIQLNGTTLTTMSLAGTLTTESEEWTQKEKLEQSVTTKFILEIFKKFGLITPLETEIKETRSGELRHLQSVYKTEIKLDHLSEILSEFSPTPAVGGYPKDKAVAYLNGLEDFNRELFTGFWGPKYDSNMSLHVNLRCAKITNNQQLFYAGCGVNLGSEVQKEWDETAAKMNVTAQFRN